MSSDDFSPDSSDAVAWFDENVESVVERQQSLAPEKVNAWLDDVLPNQAALVLDVGAGWGGTNQFGEPSLWLCSGCRRQVSVLAGTVFQDRHLPMRTWFRAMWYITSQKNGVSALGLQRVLGLGSYRTAWLMLHKLRQARAGEIVWRA
jgi:hypothetical protein